MLFVLVTSCASSELTPSAVVACDDLASCAGEVESCCCLQLVDISIKLSFSFKLDHTHFVS